MGLEENAQPGGGLRLVPLAFLFLISRAFAAEPGWIADPANGCKAWNPNPQPGESIRWNGGCRDGLAYGQGSLLWFDKNGNQTEHESGRFRKGRLDGHGGQYFSNGNKYVGDWVEGRLNGHGISIRNGDRYSGSWRGGRWNGFGTLLTQNGERTIGSWRNGKRHGYAILAWKNGDRYEGNWTDGFINGFGTEKWPNGGVYRGEWVKGVRTGKGTYRFPDGTTLEGDWKDDQLNGACVIQGADGSHYQGACLGFAPDGQGVKLWKNGDRYEGEWQAGQRSGHGLFLTAKGERYDGDWHFDREDGQGKLTRADGRRYEGEMLSGKPSGWGVGTAADGKRSEGYWADDRFLGLAWFAPRAPESSPVWPQDVSDIPADSEVLFGRLPNGMRYAIRRNGTPKDQVAFRLRFDVGSIHEKPDQRGLAHLLEHMAFRGSTHIADGEAFRTFERLGGQVGADTNAFTTQTQTSFHLNLPHGDRASLETALALMRETASELALTREAVESERAVVIAEARLYDTPAQHELIRQNEFLYRGQPIGDHLPIGDISLLEHFSDRDLRAFYRAYYRPERATLIVVGAIDPAEMEREIRSRFGDWRGQGEPGPDPERQPPHQRPPEVQTHIGPQAPGVLLAEWVMPYADATDNRSIETANVTRNLAIGAINRAYEQAAHSGKVPFSSANLAYGEIARSADIVQLSVGLTNLGDWRKGAGAVYGLMRQTLATGLSQEDLDRQIDIYRAAHDKAVEGTATRETRDLAEGLMASIDSGTVFRSPATDKAIFEQAVAALTPAKADAALKSLFETGGPLFFVAGTNLPNDLAGLPDLWTHAEAPPTDRGEPLKAWPYDHIGEQGKILSKTADPALGVTHLSFANGVALAIRPSKASAGQILINAHIDLPAWTRPPAVTPPYWSCSPLILGGVQKLSYPDLADFLHRSATAVNCTADPRGVLLSLAAQPEHLDAALQALAAYIGDPAWRPEAMTQTRDHFFAVALQFDSTLEGRLEREGPVLFHDGDVRWRAVPEPADLPGMSLEQAKAYLAPALADAPLSVVITGDVSAERAAQAAAATLGALPKRKDAKMAPPPAGTVKFPAPNESPKVLKGPRIKDQALALMAWPTHDAITELDTVYDLEIASMVLQRRLFDKFRTELGATYTPSADHSGDLDLPGSGFFYVDAIAPPDKLPLFYQTVSAILADLRGHEVGADEFERARKPLLDGQIEAEESNAYWAGWLEGPTREAYARNRATGLKRATPKAVQQAIRTYLLDNMAWKAEIRPEG